MVEHKPTPTYLRFTSPAPPQSQFSLLSPSDIASILRQCHFDSLSANFFFMHHPSNCPLACLFSTLIFVPFSVLLRRTLLSDLLLVLVTDPTANGRHLHHRSERLQNCLHQFDWLYPSPHTPSCSFPASCCHTGPPPSIATHQDVQPHIHTCCGCAIAIHGCCALAPFLRFQCCSSLALLCLDCFPHLRSWLVSYLHCNLVDPQVFDIPCATCRSLPPQISLLMGFYGSYSNSSNICSFRLCLQRPAYDQVVQCFRHQHSSSSPTGRAPSSRLYHFRFGHLDSLTSPELFRLHVALARCKPQARGIAKISEHNFHWGVVASSGQPSVCHKEMDNSATHISSIMTWFSSPASMLLRHYTSKRLPTAIIAPPAVHLLKPLLLRLIHIPCASSFGNWCSMPTKHLNQPPILNSHRYSRGCQRQGPESLVMWAVALQWCLHFCCIRCFCAIRSFSCNCTRSGILVAVASHSAVQLPSLKWHRVTTMRTICFNCKHCRSGTPATAD